MLVTRQMMRVMSLQPHAPHDYRVTADALWAAALSIKETELKSHLQKQLKTDMYSMQQIETATELWNSMLEIKNLVVRVSRGGKRSLITQCTGCGGKWPANYASDLATVSGHTVCALS